MSRQTFACGCVLESDGPGIDLVPCSKHDQEYIETYELGGSGKSQWRRFYSAISRPPGERGRLREQS